MALTSDIRVIGVGSHHGPDTTGWLACEMLQAQTTSTQIEWQLCRTPAQLPDLVANHKAVVIVDAVLSDEPVGEVVTFAWPEQQAMVQATCSSHNLNVYQALQLASVLGQLPRHTYILGITVNRHQQDPSLIVKNALPQLRNELTNILHSLATH